MSLAYFEDEFKLRCPLGEVFDRTVAIFDLLGWKWKMDDETEILAYTRFSVFGWGERITISVVEKDQMVVSSESLYPFQVFDLGKNRANVEKFIEIFNNATLPMDQSQYAYEKHRSFLDRFFSG